MAVMIRWCALHALFVLSIGSQMMTLCINFLFAGKVLILPKIDHGLFSNIPFVQCFFPNMILFSALLFFIWLTSFPFFNNFYIIGLQSGARTTFSQLQTFSSPSLLNKYPNGCHNVMPFAFKMEWWCWISPADNCQQCWEVNSWDDDWKIFVVCIFRSFEFEATNNSFALGQGGTGTFFILYFFKNVVE